MWEKRRGFTNQESLSVANDGEPSDIESTVDEADLEDF